MLDQIGVRPPEEAEIQPSDLPRLTATETAARLGVKPESVYAYVSRGLLTRARTSRGSTFDPLEVEAFAATRRGRGRAPLLTAGQPTGAPLMTIETDIALLEDDELYFRGRLAGQLATERTFETVCRWIWTGAALAEPAAPFRAPAAMTDRVARLALWPEDTVSLDRIHLAVIAAAGADPLRHDLAPATVSRQAAGLLPIMVDCLPLRGSSVRPADPQPAMLADRLWPRLAAGPSSPERIRVLNAALVLLLDHDLAASTMAVRAAASARANLYATISSGLGALDSALHGNASVAAHAMLGRVLAGAEVDRVLAETVATGGGIPGFGHRIYRSRDPRAQVILDLLDPLPEAGPALAAHRRLVAAVTALTPSFGNVDLALATMAHAFELGADAGMAVFAVGRTAGWVAHAMHEYTQAPLRLRPVGRYVGPD